AAEPPPARAAQRREPPGAAPRAPAFRDRRTPPRPTPSEPAGRRAPAPPPRGRSPADRPSRWRPPGSQLFVDLGGLAQLREIVLALLHHRLVGKPVAQLFLHFRQRLGRDRPAALDHDDVVATPVPGGPEEAGDLAGLKRESGLLDGRDQLPPAEPAHVAALLGGGSVGEITRHLGEGLAGADAPQG